MNSPTTPPESRIRTVLEAETQLAAQNMPDLDSLIAVAFRRRRRRNLATGLGAGVVACAVAAGGFGISNLRSTPSTPAAGTEVTFPSMKEPSGGSLAIGLPAVMQVSESGCPYIDVPTRGAVWPRGTYILHAAVPEQNTLRKDESGWVVVDGTGTIRASEGQRVDTRPFPHTPKDDLSETPACSSMLKGGALPALVTF